MIFSQFEHDHCGAIMHRQAANCKYGDPSLVGSSAVFYIQCERIVAQKGRSVSVRVPVCRVSVPLKINNESGWTKYPMIEQQLPLPTPRDITALDLDRDSIFFALDVAQTGIWSVDPLTGIGRCNNRAYSLLNLDPSRELSLEDILTYHVYPEDRTKAHVLLDQAFMERNGGRYRDVLRIKSGEGETRWVSWDVFSRVRDGAIVSITGVLHDVTEEQIRAEQQGEAAIHLNHRVKNMLAMVQAITYQSFRRELNLHGPVSEFQSRLRTLAKAHDLLVEEKYTVVRMDTLARRVLSALGAPMDRITLEGFDLTLSARQGVSMSLVLHELCTNAMKYGALWVPLGAAELSWSRDTQAELVRINWTETSGPPVIEPERKGFGTRMIERAIALEFGGSASLHFSPEGLTCTMTIPLQAFQHGDP